jgi:WD40 repeat protein
MHMRSRSQLSSIVIAAVISLFAVETAVGQYFGRNKVQYDQFDFQILPTEHFDIYFYPEQEEKIYDVARMAERWYRRHTRTFLREFRDKKPLIFYASDADFQQTNVIGGFIGEGTGGVTESLKQRVVMPLTGIYGETDHVLGHELVHSFQYDIAFGQRDTIPFSIGMLPLWLVEGMAEYLSLGREDPHTAMWLRDAVLRDDLPTTQQLSRDFRYFPYRYGQAYMAYVGGIYGDVAVTNLFKLAGRVGVDSAFVYALGIRPDSLSAQWQRSVRQTYEPLMEGRTHPSEIGRRVLAGDLGSGNINIAPALSPDGNYVAFLSERDIFSINLFVADANTGEVISRLRTAGTDPHFDAIRFINSAGSWSPDGRQLAIITFVQGGNEIAIWDVGTRSFQRRIRVAGVGALANPAWSPDGQSIVVTGLDGGISDLYHVDLQTGAVRQLTADKYADLQPTWSPDGRYIAFASDRGPNGSDFDRLEFAELRIGIYDLETDEVRTLTPFGDAQHVNPAFSADGNSLFFISNQDGFRDVYRYDLIEDSVYRVTDLKTGVSGITKTAPALSVAAQTGRMMFSVFYDGNYSIHALEADETVGELVEIDEDLQRTTVATAGILPPIQAAGEGLVAAYLADPESGLVPAPSPADLRGYSPRLRLDFVAPPTVGVSVGGTYGTRLAGGIGFFFSDMLGDRQLGLIAQAQGTVKDFGAQVSYIDRSRRTNLGVSAGHIPLLSSMAFVDIAQDPETGVVTQRVSRLNRRVFINEVSGIAAYPLTQTRRFEANLGVVRYGFDYELEQFFLYSGGTNRVVESLPSPDALYLAQGALAYVGDYSFFGFTSPVSGGRYRFQLQPLVGSATFVAALADYRRYHFFNPVTIAWRGMHIGNYGAAEGDIFASQYLGYWYYPAFVRGYSFTNFEPWECSQVQSANGQTACPEADRLFGTRVALASAEVRVPFFGTDQFGLVNFPYLPTELVFFADAGLAWTAEDPPEIRFARRDAGRIPVMSVGTSARINLLGAMVFEIYYAYPFQRPERGGHFGMLFSPGW